MKGDVPFDIDAWLMEFEKEEILIGVFYPLYPATNLYWEPIYD